MRKSIMGILIIVACIVAVYGIFSQLPEQLTEEDLAREEMTLRIKATDFKFDKETYTVQSGETKIVELMNVQGIHGIEIKGLDVKLEGDNLSKEITFTEPGEYEIVCSVMCGIGHYDMVSKLVVE